MQKVQIPLIIKALNGHAWNQTTFPLIGFSHTPVNFEPKEFFGQRNPKAIEAQALSNHLAQGAQVEVEYRQIR